MDNEHCHSPQSFRIDNSSKIKRPQSHSILRSEVAPNHLGATSSSLEELNNAPTEFSHQTLDKNFLSPLNQSQSTKEFLTYDLFQTSEYKPETFKSFPFNQTLTNNTNTSNLRLIISNNLGNALNPNWALTNFSLPPDIYNWYLDEFCSTILRDTISQSIAAFHKSDFITLRFQASVIKYAALPSSALRLAIAAEKLQNDCNKFLEISYSEGLSISHEPSHLKKVQEEQFNQNLLLNRMQKSYSEFIHESQKILKESQLHFSNPLNSKINNNNTGKKLYSNNPKSIHENHSTETNSNIRIAFSNKLLKTNISFPKFMSFFILNNLWNFICSKIFAKSPSDKADIDVQSCPFSPQSPPKDLTKQKLESYGFKETMLPSPIKEGTPLKKMPIEHKSDDLEMNYDADSLPPFSTNSPSCSPTRESPHQTSKTKLQYLELIYNYTYYTAFLLFILSAWFLPFLVIPSALFIFIMYNIFRISYNEFRYLYYKYFITSSNNAEPHESNLNFFPFLDSIYFTNVQPDGLEYCNSNIFEGLVKLSTIFVSRLVGFIKFAIKFFTQFFKNVCHFIYPQSNEPPATSNLTRGPKLSHFSTINNLNNPKTELNEVFQSLSPSYFDPPVLTHSNIRYSPSALRSHSKYDENFNEQIPNNSQNLPQGKFHGRISSQKFLCTTPNMKRSRGFENLQAYDNKSRRSFSSHAF